MFAHHYSRAVIELEHFKMLPCLFKLPQNKNTEKEDWKCKMFHLKDSQKFQGYQEKL